MYLGTDIAGELVGINLAMRSAQLGTNFAITEGNAKCGTLPAIKDLA